MRFLIDECLHPSLTKVSHAAGHDRYHVSWRGLSGRTDRELREVATREELVFVTNNARDFRRLMGVAALHAGLVVIVPNIPPAMQRDLFTRALREIAKLPDMVNKVIEVDLEEVRLYELPLLE